MLFDEQSVILAHCNNLPTLIVSETQTEMSTAVLDVVYHLKHWLSYLYQHGSFCAIVKMTLECLKICHE